MQRQMLKSKIHRATVTDANLDYVGSITIDRDLMDVADLAEFEQVHVVDINNGSRFVTYVIEGKPGSGVMCVNGAAARLVSPGDKIIVIAYCHVTQQEAGHHRPRVVLMDDKNGIKDAHQLAPGVPIDPGEPLPRA